MPRNVLFTLGALMVASSLLHVWLANELNVVEDESAYAMDAWQISSHVLPFREFGATKGPVFLFLLKGWQLLTGQSLVADRLFNSLLHVISIPLLYLFTQALTKERSVALLAATFWALTPVAVSLTSNIIHAPLELVWILVAATLLTARPQKKDTYIWAAVFFFLAVLTRATTAAFLPMLFLLHFFHPRGGTWLLPGGVKRFFTFCLTGALLLALTIAIIYPLYGWPKTAFFFNADALFIAHDQQAVYQPQTVSPLTMLFRGLSPLWYEGLPLILLAATLPFLNVRATTLYLRLVIVALLILAAHFFYQPLSAYLQVHASTFIFFVLAGATAAALLIPLREKITRQQILSWAVIGVWAACFMGFYRFWGRDPTPFYVLETIPAFSLAAALAVHTFFRRSHLLGVVVTTTAALALITPYFSLLEKQYRGTVAIQAAYAAGQAVQNHVPPGEAIFTAQPSYAYLGGRPLYKHLTHPGWYLAEHAGIVPTDIRRVFFPDLDVLLRSVETDINWIVTDWRTNDVYFSDRTETSRAFQVLLTEKYEPVIEIPNDVSRPIILYQRK